MSLEKYNKKRDFSVTSEPKGENASSKRKLKNNVDKKVKSDKKKSMNGGIFVVQYHVSRVKHFDLRLEHNGVLLSWAVPKGFSFNPLDKRLAVHVEDHPIEYAEFEGTIPKGEYGGGTVMIWDRGTWQAAGDVDEMLKRGSIKFVIHGERIKGAWALVRLKDEKNWLLIKEKDEFIKKSSGISHFKTSVKTGRTINEISDGKILNAPQNPFQKVDVMLAKLEHKVPQGDDYAFEIKYDGYRTIAFIEGGHCRLVSRNGKDFSDKFMSVCQALIKLAHGRSMVFDGEMTMVDEHGKSDFQALQNYMKNPSDGGLVYVIFDILALDGIDLRSKTLLERKSILEDVLKTAPNNLVYSQHVIGQGEKSFNLAKKLKLEGIIAKRIDSSYTSGRKGDWIKVKVSPRQEFVIGGFTRSSKRTNGISSLLLGYYNNEEFIYIGRTGTGINENENAEIFNKLKKNISKKSFFTNKVAKSGDETIFYVKPRLVCEVQYAEITNEHMLRQASFKGIREDKSAKEVTLENNKSLSLERNIVNSDNNKKSIKKEQLDNKNSVLGVKISNPERVVYNSKKLTKLDVAQYYAAVSKRMLKYINGRLVSVVRCHGGVNGECFYKKHPMKNSDKVKIVKVKNSEGEKSEYFYLDSAEGIIKQVQLGTLEFHIWASQMPELEKPNYMVFDLDPDENMSLENVRRGVKDLKKVLDKLGLKSFLKTSGGKGYHIVVPFAKSVGWQDFYSFAKEVALIMEQKWQDRYTTNVRKDSRKGKIFIDYMRNNRASTSVAPYSLRARKGAKVSMPISWRELDKIAPDGVDLMEAKLRIKKADPWKNFFSVNQKIKN